MNRPVVSGPGQDFEPGQGLRLADRGLGVDPQRSGRLSRLKAEGYALVVVTNQSGVARLHDLPGRQAGAAGAAVDGFYYCPRLDVGFERCDGRWRRFTA